LKKYVIFDFNGTLLNDVDLSIDLLNQFLIEQNKPIVDEKKYKDIFGFPIRDYYIRSGIDLEKHDFDELAQVYIDRYTKQSLNCKLYNNVIYTLKELQKKDIKLVVLSATEYNMLCKQLEYYNIYEYFDNILGTTNYRGETKDSIGHNYIISNNINPKDVVVVGDTLHDFEVAQRIGCDSILLSCGHQSREKLESCNTVVIDDIMDVIKYI